MARPRRLLPVAVAVVAAAAVAIPFAVANDLGPDEPETVDQVAADTVADAAAAPLRYVALGDSYTSAPGVPPVDPSAPPVCGRSAVNYPHLVATRLGAELTDVSCGGADTMSLYEEQVPGVGAQLDALTRDTTLVTLGIGGNDNDLFATAIAGCAGKVGDVLAGDVAGALEERSSCRERYGDRFRDDIEASGVLVEQALVNIRAETAPGARIVVVGYPNLLPTTDAGRLACLAAGVPFSAEDMEFLDEVERQLNTMLRTAAEKTKNIYLDTYTPSIGHDMCAAPGVRWVEPTIPLSPAAPVHPNAAGQAAVADALVALLRS